MGAGTIGNKGWLGRFGAWLTQTGEISLARGGPDRPSEYEVVFVGNEMEAEVVRGRLEVDNVPSMIQRESAGAIIGVTMGPLSNCKVLVPSALAERARQILTEEVEWSEASDDGQDEQGEGDATNEPGPDNGQV